MSDIKFDILDYIGKMNDGVIALISLVYHDNYYEGTFYYNMKNIVALTVDRELESKLGCVIEDWPGYTELVLQIIKRVVPIEEIINRLDDFDINKYQQKDTNVNFIDSEDPSFSSATQSITN